MELLEYLTPEFPDSIWFDDRNRPKRETRSEIVRRSFELAIPSLKRQFGVDLEYWRWGSINPLKVCSLTQMPELGRNCWPTVGTEFKVNSGPQSRRGRRRSVMADDCGLRPSRSKRWRYPVGQSENPESPYYDDQMRR